MEITPISDSFHDLQIEKTDLDLKIESLHEKIGFVYRNHIVDHDNVTPYEVAGAPNYPGTSNLILIPQDAYSTVLSIKNSLKHKDYEELGDATIRLIGIPANLANAVGSGLTYLVTFGALSKTVLSFLPFAYIAGIGLCVIEGAVDTNALVRQKTFESHYNFEILSELRHILTDFNPYKAVNALDKLEKLVQKPQEEMEEVFGKENWNRIRTLIANAKRDVDANPYQPEKALKKHREGLKEVAKILLLKNLSFFQQHYLQMNPDEVAEEVKHVAEKHGDLSEEEQVKLVEKLLNDDLAIKKKRLARRIRPWIVRRASESISPLINGLIKGDSEAIDEGLKLFDDIHIQSQKKKLAHTFGILALGFAAISIITLIVGAPILIPYVLVALATVFAVARTGVFSAMLDQSGWTFEAHKLLPKIIQKKVLGIEEQKEETNGKFRQIRSNKINDTYKIETLPIFDESKFSRLTPSAPLSETFPKGSESSLNERLEALWHSIRLSSYPKGTKFSSGGLVVHPQFVRQEQ
jgi:hypothetical protein